ncbi:YfiT family bacillithiol transferase [Pontibacter sp. G13]|uniref:YfiT family bacillithiol transferase n=1 Tax=Pontibacter sp. G13 TaxID=3074898 RepID=UPI00288B4267|nr:putative metal-dependent hydrolase [Pontibacter sp. G13]WNJ17641.1 putative metal-dependent hydrolase [Pontibacter sp. G13]
MDTSTQYALSYPIGPWELHKELDAAARESRINILREGPSLYREAVAGWSDEQLDTPYRPEGWTVRQVLHHVPDSHMNAYIRFRWALTEDNPLIKVYDQVAWAQLPDSAGPVDVSLDLLEALHTRLTRMLDGLQAADFERKLRHPEAGEINLNELLCMYSWHTRHHLRHITDLASRKNW